MRVHGVEDLHNAPAKMRQIDTVPQSLRFNLRDRQK